jgi:hypothetical protein
MDVILPPAQHSLVRRESDHFVRMEAITDYSFGVGVGIVCDVYASSQCPDVDECSAFPRVPRWPQSFKGTISDIKHQTIE